MLNSWKKRLLLCLLTVSLVSASLRPIQAQTKPAGGGTDAAVTKAVGTIKSANADSITVAVESGGEITAAIAASTKILRVPPGEKDLKNATPLQVQDLQPGDRVLVRGLATADPHAIAALAVIVMKQADVSSKQQHDREDWQKRGVDGVVSKVDPAGTITISSGGMGTSHDIAVHFTKTTVLRRYAPDSAKFDDAKPAPVDQIKPGDQLRARGTRSQDGGEIAADEVVSGTFRNIKGTITGIDAASNTLTVQDAIGKATVTIKVDSDSQLKKLAPEMAQRIATRLKGANGDQPAGAKNAPTQNGPPAGSAAPGMEVHSGVESHSNHGPGGNGPPDLQRLLARLPGSKLTDLQKGDSIIVLSTQGNDAGTVTAIQLLAGVDPILAAAPNRSPSSLLSPWSLNTSGGEGESAP